MIELPGKDHKCCNLCRPPAHCYAHDAVGRKIIHLPLWADRDDAPSDGTLRANSEVVS